MVTHGELSGLRVRELHPTMGVEVRGLQPGVPLDDATLAGLRDLFDRASVLVFPDLDIDEDFQRYLVYSLIGAPLPPTGEGPEAGARRAPMLVSNKEEGGAAPYGRLLFHCDTMWSEEPQELLSLYGVDVHPPSVPTLFANMLHAWETLPDDLRARVEHLQARQGFEHRYANRGGDDDVIDTYYEESRWTITPVARDPTRATGAPRCSCPSRSRSTLSTCRPTTTRRSSRRCSSTCTHPRTSSPTTGARATSSSGTTSRSSTRVAT